MGDYDQERDAEARKKLGLTEMSADRPLASALFDKTTRADKRVFDADRDMAARRKLGLVDPALKEPAPAVPQEVIPLEGGASNRDQQKSSWTMGTAPLPPQEPAPAPPSPGQALTSQAPPVLSGGPGPSTTAPIPSPASMTPEPPNQEMSHPWEDDKNLVSRNPEIAGLSSSSPMMSTAMGVAGAPHGISTTGAVSTSGGESPLSSIDKKLAEAKAREVELAGNIENTYNEREISSIRIANLEQQRNQELQAKKAEALEKQARLMDENKAADDAGFAAATAYREKTDQLAQTVAHMEVNPQRIYGDMNTGMKLAAIIGSVMGGWLQGRGATKDNPFETSMNRLIDEDVAAQEKNIQNRKFEVGQRQTIYEEMRRQGMDQAQARAAYADGLFTRAGLMADNQAKTYDTAIAYDGRMAVNQVVEQQKNDFLLANQKEQSAAYERARIEILRKMAAAGAARAAEEKKIAEVAEKLALKYADPVTARRMATFLITARDPLAQYVGRPGIPSIASLKLQNNEESAVSGQRLAFEKQKYSDETYVPELAAHLPAVAAHKINEGIAHINTRDASLRTLITAFEDGSYRIPGKGRAIAEQAARNIANEERKAQETGVPTVGDNQFVLAIPHDLPWSDITGNYLESLKFELANRKRQNLTAIANAYHIPLPKPPDETTGVEP